MSVHTSKARLSLESLNRRDVPSATVALQGQLLVITGDASADAVTVADVGDQLQVTIDGEALPLMPRALIPGVVFLGGDGNDAFVNSSSALATAVGGSGDDVLVGLGAGVNVFNGSEGNDVLVGGAGTDYLIGDNGDDTLYGGQGRDVVYGGAGRDHELAGHDANDLFDDRGTDPNDAVDDGPRGRGNDG
ncbi:MAG: hypothetical protein J0I06_04665 [Planctomycetes bacterium]|nr:hypothetical protein [Planctomycetota bacterium]